eukprot:403373570
MNVMPIRYFSKNFKKTQPLSEFYQELKNGMHNDQNPVDLLRKLDPQHVDLPAFDLIFDRFIDSEWGANRPKTPLKLSAKLLEFVKLLSDMNVVLNKEQICKLVDFYQVFLEFTPPYSRIDGIYFIAKIEQKSSSTHLTPYFDELHDFYSSEYDFLKEKSLHLESVKAILNLSKALKISRYFDEQLLRNLSTVYKVLSNFDQLAQIPQLQINILQDASDLLNVFTFFNVQNQEMSLSLKKILKKYVGIIQNSKDDQELKDHEIDQGFLHKFKSICLKYTRYQMLYLDLSEDNLKLHKDIYRFLMVDYKTKHDMELSHSDFNQIYQSMLAMKSHLKSEISGDLLSRMREIWLKNTEETIISKFEQEVYECTKRLPVKSLFNSNDPETGLEIDILITEVEKTKLVDFKIAIEVNGVYHYARNSERQMGRDKIKQSIIRQNQSEKYKLITIPYFEWALLENQSKSKYLMDLINLALSTNQKEE